MRDQCVDTHILDDVHADELARRVAVNIALLQLQGCRFQVFENVLVAAPVVGFLQKGLDSPRAEAELAVRTVAATSLAYRTTTLAGALA